MASQCPQELHLLSHLGGFEPIFAYPIGFMIVGLPAAIPCTNRENRDIMKFYKERASKLMVIIN